MSASESVAANPVRIIPAELRAGTIMVDGDSNAHARQIDAEQILIFRGAFSVSEMCSLRKAVQRWAKAVEPFPVGQSASRPGINFHRIDDGSVSTSMPHIFHQFGFGQPAELNPKLRASVMAVSTALLNFQNELAGTRFRLEGDSFRTKIMRHPRGGGYLVPHRHPYLPQRVALFLNLSEPGRDYFKGGVRFKAKGLWIDAFEHFRIGDVLAWRYDMIHDVAPVDADQSLKWAGDDGFWIFALENEGIHQLSSATH